MKPKGTKAETREAKRLFLYGDDEGNKVRSVNRLVELSGCGEQTIRKYLPEWEKELEEITAQSSKTGLALSLSAEKLHLHKLDMEHLRDQINQVKFELDRLEEITARLEKWLEKFDDDDRDNALTIFDHWQRACGQKSSLRSQFLAMQKQWTSLEGIVDLKDIAVAREKEMAKGHAKLELKKLENQPLKPVNPLEGGVFTRPARID